MKLLNILKDSKGEIRMSLLIGKTILIMGVRNKWSIAWGIAKRAHANGAKLIFTYQGEREKSEVESLANLLKGTEIFKCDVSGDSELDDFFNLLRDKNIKLDSVVHAIAHAKREDIQNSFLNTSRDGFSHALNVSAYSLIAVVNRAVEIMNPEGSIVTITFEGAEKVYPGYNVMGVAKAALEASVKYLSYELGEKEIRVNAISAGPIKTISAKGIKDFSDILGVVGEKSPFKRNVNLDELGNSAVFLMSELSKGITGEIMYVDCGYNIMGI